MTPWQPLTKAEQLSEIVRESAEQPVIIFKHSTTCSISAMAKSKIERQWTDAGLDSTKLYYLDLLSYRPISQEMAQQFNVQHESPQLLLIQDGECTFHASHNGIRLSDVKQKVK
ncbi:bacillithiol system redox-active protein YtxJ [Hymenobacter psychrophilus]|uniref:Bacillithiol system protein YtxJ n=1 Tax=Hymenobacter psychrophilus TaxID=651662 RepID=A0A1H3HJS5_9BACT|nr:bacillithiol system redox-active protein YtxJ [Hymenobacter psychrophilus]SDY15731.1 bacillithiol system protein YtxJ [Hymenobacter psychrophilus]